MPDAIPGTIRDFVQFKVGEFVAESLEPQLVVLKDDVDRNARNIQALDQRTADVQGQLAAAAPALGPEQILALVQDAGFVAADDLAAQHAELETVLAQDRQDIQILDQRTTENTAGINNLGRTKASAPFVDDLAARVSGMEARTLTDQQLADIAATLNSVRDLPGEVDAHESRITALEQQPDIVRTDREILTLAASLDTPKSTIDYLSQLSEANRIRSRDNAGQIDANRQDITALRDAIVVTDVADYATQPQLADLERQLSEVAGATESLATADAALSVRIGANESAIAPLAEDTVANAGAIGANAARIQTLEERVDVFRTDQEILDAVAASDVFATRYNLELLAAKVENVRISAAGTATELNALEKDTNTYLADIYDRLGALPTLDEVNAAVASGMDAALPEDYPRTLAGLKALMDENFAVNFPDIPTSRQEFQDAVDATLATIKVPGSELNTAMRNAVGNALAGPLASLKDSVVGLKEAQEGLRRQFDRIKVEYGMWRDGLKQTKEQETGLGLFADDVSPTSLINHLLNDDDSPTQAFLRGGTSRLGRTYLGLMPLLQGTSDVFTGASGDFDKASTSIAAIGAAFPPG